MYKNSETGMVKIIHLSETYPSADSVLCKKTGKKETNAKMYSKKGFDFTITLRTPIFPKGIPIHSSTNNMVTCWANSRLL